MKLYGKRKMLKRLLLILLVTMGVVGATVKVHGRNNNIPKVSGRLVYHSYSSYEAEDSKLYLFDFDNREKVCLSDKFANVFNTMNADLNNDGSEVVFMGMENNASDKKWDIYTYNLESGNLENLTRDNELRNEDPKFSPDGKKIIFKQGHWDEKEDDMVYDLKELTLKNNKIRTITKDIEEDSMPYYSSDGNTIYYTRGIGKSSQIYEVSRNSTKSVKKVYSSNNVMCYYPIVYDETLYFTKWYSKSNNCDTIMKMNLDTKKVSKLKFNNKNYNCSDPCPLSDKYIIMSSTKGDGGYDLYLADMESGNTWSLSEISKEINDDKEQLGASCFIKSIG